MSDHERAHPLSQAKWARGSVIAMSSAVTLDARASRAWVRRYARTTPGVVEAARANNIQGLPIGSAYLREASSSMQTTLIRRSNRLVNLGLVAAAYEMALDARSSRTARVREVCGLPVTTPAAPPAPNACPAQWTAIVTADRDYYKRVIARGGPDTVEFPEFFPERRISLHGNTLIGRTNRRQGVEPGIDLGIHPTDRGVSTQHAVLRTRDAGLTVADLGSTNGTSLNDSDDLLANGEEITLTNGDRIHVGAWTTITVARSQGSPQ